MILHDEMIRLMYPSIEKYLTIISAPCTLERWLVYCDYIRSSFGYNNLGNRSIPFKLKDRNGEDYWYSTSPSSYQSLLVMFIISQHMIMLRDILSFLRQEYIWNEVDIEEYGIVVTAISSGYGFLLNEYKTFIILLDPTVKSQMAFPSGQEDTSSWLFSYFADKNIHISSKYINVLKRVREAGNKPRDFSSPHPSVKSPFKSFAALDFVNSL